MPGVTEVAATTWGLLVWGAHVMVPWRLRRGPLPGQRLWGLWALPLLLSAWAFWVMKLEVQVDAALAAGLGVLPESGVISQILIVLLFSLAAADLVLLAGRHRLEPSGWTLMAGLGFLGVLGPAVAEELVRIGEGPGSDLFPFGAAVACRSLVIVAAGEVLAPGRPWTAVVAAAALLLYYPTLPESLRQALAAEGDLLTLGAGACLFAAAPWVPPRLHKPTLLAGVILAALLFVRAAHLSQELGAPALLPLPPLPGH